MFAAARPFQLTSLNSCPHPNPLPALHSRSRLPATPLFSIRCSGAPGTPSTLSLSKPCFRRAASLTSLESILTKAASPIPFRITTYEKDREGGTPPSWFAPSPSRSLSVPCPPCAIGQVQTLTVRPVTARRRTLEGNGYGLFCQFLAEKRTRLTALHAVGSANPKIGVSRCAWPRQRLFSS